MIEETVNQLDKIVNEVGKYVDKEIDWETRPAPGKWSKKEILGHLIDSAQVNLQRFVRCTYQQNFKLIYEQDEWVRASRYQNADAAELLMLWKLLNQQISRVLSGYPAERLNATCDTGRVTESLHTVEWLAEDYIVHLNHHLEQIFQ
jgi:hypothetical protein